MRNAILIVLFFCSLVACQSRDSASLSQNSAEQSGALPETWFTRALQKAKISCPENCPRGIGLIAFYEYDFGEDSSIEQCTGFVVDKTVVATNSHCIPDDIKSGAADCSTRIGFVLPQGGGRYIHRMCGKIISMSNATGALDLDDYAFIEVVAMDVEPLAISQAGASDGAQVQITKLNPHEDGSLGGAFESLQCQVVQKSLLNLYAIHSFSRTGLAMGCEARGGNSGSPVMDAGGAVIGLLQSKKVSDYLLHLGDQLARRSQLKLPEEPPPHFVFSNMSCIPHPITGARAQSDCDYYRERSLAHVFNLVVDPAFEKFGTITSKWRYKLPNAFEYFIDTVPGFATILTATPLCVKRQFLQKNAAASYDFHFSDFLRVVKEYKVDEYLRFHTTTYFNEERAYSNYKLDLTGPSPKLLKAVDDGGTASFTELTLKVCE